MVFEEKNSFMTIKKATKLAIVLSIVFLAFNSKAHADTFSIDNHTENFSVIAGHFTPPVIYTGFVTNGDQGSVFVNGVYVTESPISQGEEVPSVDWNSLVVGDYVDICESPSGVSATDCTDPSVVGWVRITVVSGTPVNIWLPVDEASLTASAGDLGQITSGTIGGLWGIFMILIALPLVFNVILPRTQKLLPKDTDKDAREKATRDVTEHMKAEHRGEEIVRDIATHTRRRRPFVG